MNFLEDMKSLRTGWGVQFVCDNSFCQCFTSTVVHHVKKTVGPEDAHQLQNDHSLHQLLGQRRQRFGRHLRTWSTHKHKTSSPPTKTVLFVSLNISHWNTSMTTRHCNLSKTELCRLFKTLSLLMSLSTYEESDSKIGAQF